MPNLRFVTDTHTSTDPALTTRCYMCLDYFDDPADAPIGSHVQGSVDLTGDGEYEEFRGYLCDQHNNDAYWETEPIYL